MLTILRGSDGNLANQMGGEGAGTSKLRISKSAIDNLGLSEQELRTIWEQDNPRQGEHRFHGDGEHEVPVMVSTKYHARSIMDGEHGVPGMESTEYQGWASTEYLRW